MPDLLDKLAQIKALGYIIKLDSNGSRPEVLRIAVDQGLVDYVAMDIKNSKEKYALTIR
jgi:pyruvate formate lyase activating enzyme